MRTTKLEKLDACDSAIEWVLTQKNSATAWQNCEYGDWMLWLAKKLNVDDRKITMTKAMSVKQVEHLIKNQKIKDIIQSCFDYANGNITREELNVAASIAADAASITANASIHMIPSYVTFAASNIAASYAAATAANVTSYATASYVASAVASAAAATYIDATPTYIASRGITGYITSTSAYTNSLKKSADICREYLTDEVLLRYKKA